MEKPCELCLRIVHPSANQMKHRMLCIDCAAEVYREIGDEEGASDAQHESEGNWWSFSNSSPKFAGQVDRMIGKTCPQCRKVH
jgi:hypothetical protein